MNQWHHVWIFVIACFSIAAQEFNGRSHDVILFQQSIDKDLIKKVLPEKVCVGEISFDSDVFFQKEEFYHLLGFSKGDFIDYRDIIKAFELFVKKNKFSTVKMATVTHDDIAHVHFIVQSEWTFGKIKIHNVYQGKHLLSQMYLMERGDVFDESKHTYSLDKIKDFLMSNGYFDHLVTSHFVYDYHTKEVIVHIFIKKGKRFHCDLAGVDIVLENGISGDSQELAALVKKKLAHSLGYRTFTQERLDRELVVLKDYLAKKGFLYHTVQFDKEIDHSLGIVNIQCKIIVHQKREIVFFGHRFFSKKKLLEIILAFGESVWLLPASLLAEEIVRVYKSKGFLSVEVVTQEEKGRSFFIIKEGPRAVIKDIAIKHSTLAQQSIIKKQCFRHVLKHVYYDSQLYDEAIALFTQFYFKQGYFAFTVVDYHCEPTDQENEFILTIAVDEGSKKYITSVSVDKYPELNESIPFKKSEPDGSPVLFDTKIIDEQRAWLMHHFQSLGYFCPRVKPMIESNDSDISIKWSVNPGEKVFFGKTVVQGSLTFPFTYIDRMLAYKEGELWDQAKIKETFKVLKGLEIFETVHFFTDYSDMQENKPVLLKLDLDDRYEVRARAGLELQHVRKYQTFSGLTYKIGGTTLIKNPTNCADQLRFDCDFARSHREIIARYRRPWFTRNPFFTILQAYSISYDQPGFIGSTNDIYTLVQNGFFLGLQRKGCYGDVGWNNGCEWMKIRITDNEEQLSFAQAIDFRPQLIDKMVPFFFTEPTIMFERLDNALNPTQGGVALISCKCMIPLKKKYKDSFFFKLLCEQSFFVPLKSVVAAVRFRCGHIFYREFSGIMPSERFYLGGSHSLRGYEADLAPPLGVFSDDDGQKHVVPRGGRTMVNGNAELRFPLYKKIGGVLFQDVGVLSGTLFADFKPQDILAATGFGLRVFTPLGPLRFDIGWKWRKSIPLERSFAWFLTFGQAF